MMTVDQTPFEGTVTADPLPSDTEVWRRVAQAVGDTRVKWPPADFLPMLPDDGTKSLVSSTAIFRRGLLGFLYLSPDFVLVSWKVRMSCLLGLCSPTIQHGTAPLPRRERGGRTVGSNGSRGK